MSIKLFSLETGRLPVKPWTLQKQMPALLRSSVKPVKQAADSTPNVDSRRSTMPLIRLGSLKRRSLIGFFTSGGSKTNRSESVATSASEPTAIGPASAVPELLTGAPAPLEASTTSPAPCEAESTDKLPVNDSSDVEDGVPALLTASSPSPTDSETFELVLPPRPSHRRQHSHRGKSRSRTPTQAEIQALDAAFSGILVGLPNQCASDSCSDGSRTPSPVSDGQTMNHPQLLFDQYTKSWIKLSQKDRPLLQRVQISNHLNALTVRFNDLVEA